MIVRKANDGDLDAIRSVSSATGQPGLDSGADHGYVALIRTTGTVLVAVDERAQLLGWGATRRHASGSLLTDLFVHPDHQGRGVGAQLLRGLWDPDDLEPRFTFSSRHPHAMPLYGRAGLHPRWPLLYLTGPAGALLSPSLFDRAIVDAAAAAHAEAQLSGVDRAADYRFWTRHPDAAAVIVRDGTRLVACGVVRPGEVVHLTCPGEADASGTLQAAFAASGTGRVTACVPGPHPAVPALLRSGFRITDYDVMMCTPDVVLPPTWAYSPGLA